MGALGFLKRIVKKKRIDHKLKQERINCFSCKHFYVTWDKKFPKGCKAFQFKTSRLPSQEVLRASGQACLKYEGRVAKIK